MTDVKWGCFDTGAEDLQAEVLPNMDEQLMMKGFGLSLEEKIPKAIQTLQYYEDLALEHDPENGYHLAFSGGKDSCVIKHLANLAGVKYKAVFSPVLEPPELFKFIKEHHPDVEWFKHKKGFFKVLAEDRGIPTRIVRWCCHIFKERSSKHTVRIFGIRAAESARRKANWKVLTPWKASGGGWCVNPILYWTDQDVWKFIRQEKIPYCSLYDEGFKRLGCVGCPMAGRKRIKEFERWPQYERAWKKSFQDYYKNFTGRLNRDGKPYTMVTKYENAEQIWDWWLSERAIDKDDGCQMGLF